MIHIRMKFFVALQFQRAVLSPDVRIIRHGKTIKYYVQTMASARIIIKNHRRLQRRVTVKWRPRTYIRVTRYDRHHIRAATFERIFFFSCNIFIYRTN